MIRKVLLGCGIASSLLYVGMNIAGSLLYPGYDTFSQQVSELSPIGAPDEGLVGAGRHAVRNSGARLWRRRVALREAQPCAAYRRRAADGLRHLQLLLAANAPARGHSRRRVHPH